MACKWAKRFNMRHLLQMMLMCAVAFQAACTSVVWNGGVYDADRAIDTHITHTLAHDQIHAFGRTAAGHLLMMGERHWYAVRDDVSQDLQRVLQAQLPAAYQITVPYTGSKSDTLPIVVHENQQFSSQFCLDYAIQNAKIPSSKPKKTTSCAKCNFNNKSIPIFIANVLRLWATCTRHCRHCTGKIRPSLAAKLPYNYK